MRVRVFGQETTVATATAIPATPTGVDSYPGEVIFSLPTDEPLQVGLSGDYDVPYAKTYTEIRITATTAGTSGVTQVYLRKNGVNQVMGYLPVNWTEHTVAIDVPCVAGDNLSVQVVAVSTGVTGMTVMVR